MPKLYGQILSHLKSECTRLMVENLKNLDECKTICVEVFIEAEILILERETPGLPSR